MPLTTITLAEMTEGDTWPGIAQIGPLVFRHYDPEDELAETDPASENYGYVIDDPPDVLVSAKLHFVREGLSEATLKCSTEYTVSGSAMHPIVITSGDGAGEDWEMVIAPMDYDDFPLESGKWEGELEVIYGTGPGTKLTIFEVVQVVNSQKTV